MNGSRSCEQLGSDIFHNKILTSHAMMQTMKCCVLEKTSRLLVYHFTMVYVNVAEMAGVKTEEPVAVAGRGKLLSEVVRPIHLGRGKQHSCLHTVL
jgi:hypothetical protein